MCFLVIKEVNEENKNTIPVRIFHKNDTGGYKTPERVFRNEDEYQKLLQMAYGELHAFKIKYARLEELSEILELIA